MCFFSISIHYFIWDLAFLHKQVLFVFFSVLLLPPPSLLLQKIHILWFLEFSTDSFGFKVMGLGEILSMCIVNLFSLLCCLSVNLIVCCCNLLFLCTGVIYCSSKDTRTIHNCPKSSSASIRDVFYIKLKVSFTKTYSSVIIKCSALSWTTRYQQFSCCWVGKPCKCFTRSYPDANHPQVKGASGKSKFNCIGESTSSFITNRCDMMFHTEMVTKKVLCKESRVR